MAFRKALLRATVALLAAVLLLPAEEAARPLSESDIAKLLEAGVTPARVVTLVAERGISFDLTPEAEQRLRQAGADDALLLALVKASTPPDEAVRRLKLAELRAADGARAAALTELAEAQKLAPHWAELHYQSGQIHEKLRLYTEAIAAWRRYLELRPETPRKQEMVAKLAEWEYRREKQKKAEALVAQASAEVEKRNLPAALDLARQAVEADPESAAAQAKLAEQLVNTRALDDGLKAAREARRLDPQSAEAHRQLSRALREKGELSEAEREARAAVRLAPDAALPHATLAVVLARQGKAEEARTEPAAAVKLAPDDWSTPAQVARELANRKDWGNALRVVLDYLADYPDRVEMRLALVQLLMEKGDPATAEHEARETVRRAPQSAPAHDQLAWVLLQKKQPDAALVEVQEALRLDPKSSWYRMRLAAISRLKDDPRTAAAEYRRIIQADPTYAPARLQLAWTLYGLKDNAGALAEAREAVRLDSSGETHFLLATVLDQSGQEDEAYREYKEALRLDPENPSAHNDLGVLLLRRGDVAGAIAEFREALRLSPANELYRKNLGIAEARR